MSVDSLSLVAASALHDFSHLFFSLIFVLWFVLSEDSCCMAALWMKYLVNIWAFVDWCCWGHKLYDHMPWCDPLISSLPLHTLTYPYFRLNLIYCDFSTYLSAGHSWLCPQFMNIFKFNFFTLHQNLLWRDDWSLCLPHIIAFCNLIYIVLQYCKDPFPCLDLPCNGYLCHLTLADLTFTGVSAVGFGSQGGQPVC